MTDILLVVLPIALFTVIGLLIASLVKPNLKINKLIFKSTKRKRLFIYYVSLILIIFVAIGIIAPKPEPINKEVTASQSQINDPVTTPKPINKEIVKPEPTPLYKVVKVVDGDTIDVNIDDKTERLRLIGIDTPETVDPGSPVQCFGKEASDKAKELLSNKQVRLESDKSQGERDKYSRLLRYVFLEDGTSYNKYVIAEGYGKEYTYSSAYKYQAEYKQAQIDAQSQKKGLWAASTCAGDTKQTASSNHAPVAPITITPDKPAASSNCDPNYSPCVPISSTDLDCKDIGFKVKIIGTDIHNFDGNDDDGLGCESY
ncbi:MAG: thermonuclease family protein [Candidatus Saccharibacteria bacterium]